MKKWLLITIILLAILIICTLFLVRPYQNGSNGKGSCPVVILESNSGICIGLLRSVNSTSILNDMNPNCTVTYSGTECKGIKLFEKEIAAN